MSCVYVYLVLSLKKFAFGNHSPVLSFSLAFAGIHLSCVQSLNGIMMFPFFEKLFVGLNFNVDKGIQTLSKATTMVIL